MQTTVQVGLLWHSVRSGNLGVGALTVSNLRLIRETAAERGITPKFTIFSMRDKEIRYVPEEEAELFVIDTKALLDPTKLRRRLSQMDCVFDIGGGDSFAEIYGKKRYMFMWLSKMLVPGATPLVLAPQTIGPFDSPLFRKSARMALNHARHVVARDQKSFDFLKDLAPDARSSLATDVAFALPFTKMPKTSDRRAVGINVSGLLFNDAETGTNRFGLSVPYNEFLRATIRKSLEAGDEVHLFAHVTDSVSAYDDDGAACDKLKGEFPEAIRVPTFAGPVEAKSYISALDFVTAGRMHACIAAYSSGVPVLPFAYSRKFSGLFGTLDYPWLVPMEGITLEGALDLYDRALGSLPEMKNDLDRGLETLEGRLDAYRAVIRSTLLEAAGQ